MHELTVEPRRADDPAAWWPSPFGADDDLGMLNHGTDAKRLDALRSVRHGRLYDLGRVLDEHVPVFPGRAFHQTLVTTAHHANHGGVGRNEVNWITEVISGTTQLGTHLDALSHLQMGGRGYNGWSAAELATPAGVSRLGAETIPQIVTRGWLVDAAAVRGRAARARRRDRARRPRRPRPGARGRRPLPHRLDFWLTTEDLPHPDNRVRVDGQANIHLSKTYFNIEPQRRLLGKLKALLGPLGCHDTAIPRWSVLDQQIPIAGIAHNCGTVRFGTDPKTSALDVDCKAHDLDNLYVVDFFPSSSAVNPALTAMANALRVGDHLLERLDARMDSQLATRIRDPQEVAS